jgi:hypothetical protein
MSKSTGRSDAGPARRNNGLKLRATDQSSQVRSQPIPNGLLAEREARVAARDQRTLTQASVAIRRPVTQHYTARRVSDERPAALAAMRKDAGADTNGKLRQ